MGLLAYYKEIWGYLRKNSFSWARDNIIFGLVMVLLPIGVLAVAGRQPDVSLMKATLLCYGVALCVYAGVYFLTAHWKVFQALDCRLEAAVRENAELRATVDGRPADLLSNLNYRVAYRREFMLGDSFSAIVVEITNELMGDREIGAARGVRANITYWDNTDNEIARVFRGIWREDVIRGSDSVTIMPGDHAELAVAWERAGYVSSPFPPESTPLAGCTRIELVLLPAQASTPLLNLSFSADFSDQSWSWDHAPVELIAPRT